MSQQVKAHTTKPGVLSSIPKMVGKDYHKLFSDQGSTFALLHPYKYTKQMAKIQWKILRIW